MRVRIEVPELCAELCEFLSGRGCLAVEAGPGIAEVTIPAAPSSFEATITLLADLDLWRAKHPFARATLQPGPLV